MRLPGSRWTACGIFVFATYPNALSLLVLLFFVMSYTPANGRPFDGEAARRVMSSAYGNSGHIEKGSFAARAQSAAQINMNNGIVPGWTASAHSGASKGSGGAIRGSNGNGAAAGK